MDARHVKLKRQRWRRMATAVIFIVAGLSAAALTEAAIRGRNIVAPSMVTALPAIPTAHVLLPDQVEAGLTRRFQEMQERMAGAATSDTERSAFAVSVPQIVSSLPRDLHLPPAARRTPQGR